MIFYKTSLSLFIRLLYDLSEGDHNENTSHKKETIPLRKIYFSTEIELNCYCWADFVLCIWYIGNGIICFMILKCIDESNLKIFRHFRDFHQRIQSLWLLWWLVKIMCINIIILQKVIQRSVFCQTKINYCNQSWYRNDINSSLRNSDFIFICKSLENLGLTALILNPTTFHCLDEIWIQHIFLQLSFSWMRIKVSIWCKKITNHTFKSFSYFYPEYDETMMKWIISYEFFYRLNPRYNFNCIFVTWYEIMNE